LKILLGRKKVGQATHLKLMFVNYNMLDIKQFSKEALDHQF